MIVLIEILDWDKNVGATVTHVKDNIYYYKMDFDIVYNIRVKKTAKGVWISGGLLFLGDFNYFLSNKNIRIIEE